MVLTLTINPLLERRFYYDAIEIGQVNRTGKEEFKAGGKGINISRQLNCLGIKNFAFTFLGGNSGKLLRNLLDLENIDYSFISAKHNTRTASLIIENKLNRITSFFGPNSNLTHIEIEEFKKKLDKMILNCSVVVFAGSSPSELADKIFPYGIELAHKYDKTSILDTYGRHLKECIDMGPTIIHNNVKELEESLAIGLSTDKSMTDFLSYLYSRNVKLSFITNGAEPEFASKFDFHFKVINPRVKEIDPTGSGDAFTAGIAYGIEKSMVFEDFLRTASALGAANAARWEVCNIPAAEIENYSAEVKVIPIGKKMRLIDDSPTV